MNIKELADKLSEKYDSKHWEKDGGCASGVLITFKNGYSASIIPNYMKRFEESNDKDFEVGVMHSGRIVRTLTDTNFLGGIYEHYVNFDELDKVLSLISKFKKKVKK